MSEIIFLDSLIKSLTERGKFELANNLLNHYYDISKTKKQIEELGTISLKHKFAEISVKCAEKNYALSNDNESLFFGRMNLSKAYFRDNQIKKAIDYNLLNLSLMPDDYELITSHIGFLRADNQWDEVIDISNKLKQQLADSDIDISDWDYPIQSTIEMNKGNIKRGSYLFLDPDKPSHTQFDIFKIKKWDGIIVPGKTLYISDGGGIGDTFLMIRFFKTLENLGMNVIFYSDLGRNDVYDILQRNGIKVCNYPFEIERDCTWTKLLYIPTLLDLKEKNLWQGPYINCLNQTKNRLKSKKIKIGIKSSGNPLFAQNEFRKISYQQITSIFEENENIEFYNFDLDYKYNNCKNLSENIEKWDDTLDYLNQMDIVLSSCTSVAHAAGSMGKSTIVFVPVLEYFIWGSTYNNNRTPWYGNNFFVVKKENSKSWQSALDVAKKLKDKILYG